MGMNRRDFLKSSGMMAGSLYLSGVPIESGQPNGMDFQRLETVLKDERSTANDMEALPRIVYTGKNKANVNVFPKEGKTLEARMFVADDPGRLYMSKPVKLNGVKSSTDIGFAFEGPKLSYSVQYRENSGRWKEVGPYTSKTPDKDLKNGDKIEIIVIGDDHSYADLRWAENTEFWRRMILNGDYIPELIRRINEDPRYLPDDWRQFPFGCNISHAQRHILLNEDPDLIINLGDTAGLETTVRERGWGIDLEKYKDEKYFNKGAKLLWERYRRAWEALMPWVSYYVAIGNHEGEEGFDPMREHSVRHRKRVLRQPGRNEFIDYDIRINPGPFFPLWSPTDGPGTAKKHERDTENYYAVRWGSVDGQDAVELIVLEPSGYTPSYPKTIDGWTLGENQKRWFKHALMESGALQKYVFTHNVVGGWPTGTKKSEYCKEGTYRRGPLFTREHYARYHSRPEMVEQTYLTELALEYGVNGWVFGHDHVEKLVEIGRNSNGKMMVGMCAGAPRFTGDMKENWSRELWTDNYGDGFSWPPDFWGTPGIVKISVNKNGSTIRYICSGRPETMVNYRQYGTNIPLGTRIGNVLHEYRVKA